MDTRIEATHEAQQGKRKPLTREEILDVLGVPVNIPRYAPQSVWHGFSSVEIYNVGDRSYKTGTLKLVLGKKPDSLFFHLIIDINEAVLVVFDEANLNILQKIYRDVLAAPTFIMALRRIKKALRLPMKVGVYPLLSEEENKGEMEVQEFFLKFYNKQAEALQKNFPKFWDFIGNLKVVFPTLMPSKENRICFKYNPPFEDVLLECAKRYYNVAEKYLLPMYWGGLAVMQAILNGEIKAKDAEGLVQRYIELKKGAVENPEETGKKLAELLLERLKPVLTMENPQSHLAYFYVMAGTTPPGVKHFVPITADFSTFQYTSELVDYFLTSMLDCYSAFEYSELWFIYFEAVFNEYLEVKIWIK